MSQNANTSKPRLLPNWMLKGKGVSGDSESQNSEKVACISLKSEMENELPLLYFVGKIHYHPNLPEASIICEDILNKVKYGNVVVIGFDMEWTASFQQGQESKTALIQICTDHFNCHLFHIAQMTGFPRALRCLLEEPNIKKVGVGIESDFWKLARDFGFSVKKIIDTSVIDLSTLANSVLKCSQMWSLDGLVKHVLKHRLKKDSQVRCSDWNKTELTQEQKQYAALDAYASYVLYEDLISIQETPSK